MSEFKKVRYVIPHFDGEKDVLNIVIKLNEVLKRHDAQYIRTNKYYGVITFSLPRNFLSTDDETKSFLALSADLRESVHPKCISWSYRKLDRRLAYGPTWKEERKE